LDGSSRQSLEPKRVVGKVFNHNDLVEILVISGSRKAIFFGKGYIDCREGLVLSQWSFEMKAFQEC
jgi:hypothetical protein